MLPCRVGRALYKVAFAALLKDERDTRRASNRCIRREIRKHELWSIRNCLVFKYKVSFVGSGALVQNEVKMALNGYEGVHG